MMGRMSSRGRLSSVAILSELKRFDGNERDSKGVEWNKAPGRVLISLLVPVSTANARIHQRREMAKGDQRNAFSTSTLNLFRPLEAQTTRCTVPVHAASSHEAAQACIRRNHDSTNLNFAATTPAASTRAPDRLSESGESRKIRRRN